MIVKIFKQVNNFLNNLPKDQCAEIFALLEDLEEYGLDAPLISMRQIKGKLWELRISQNRIFYVVIEKNIMVLLHAYKKEGQNAPQHEIETALKRMRDLLEEDKGDKR